MIIPPYCNRSALWVASSPCPLNLIWSGSLFYFTYQNSRTCMITFVLWRSVFFFFFFFTFMKLKITFLLGVIFLVVIQHPNLRSIPFFLVLASFWELIKNWVHTIKFHSMKEEERKSMRKKSNPQRKSFKTQMLYFTCHKRKSFLVNNISICSKHWGKFISKISI